MSNLPPLTFADITHLATLTEMVNNGSRVKYLSAATDDVVTGTVRSFSTTAEDTLRPGTHDDIRNCYVRITMSSGFDVYLPVMEIVHLISRREFVADR